METLKIHPRHGFKRDAAGNWAFTEESIPHRPKEGFHSVFNESTIRYLNCFDPLFRAAKAACEFEFVHTLLGVRGMQHLSWDPFETTRRAIPAMIKVHEKLEDFETQRHLGLWTYGHIVEASEPYERLANLIAISQGERFNVCRFPAHKSGRPQSPGEKIRKLDEMGKAAGLPSAADPLNEIWDRELRNSVFHADYGVEGGNVIIPGARQRYTHEQVMTLINRALAYHHTIITLIDIYREVYERPVLVPVHPKFGSFRDEKAIIVVKQGKGAIGLKHAWTAAAVCRGHIPWFFGVVGLEESKQLMADNGINFFRDDGTAEAVPVETRVK